MEIQPLRGFRDFYPQDQFRINYLKSKITQTCRLYGFEEYEGPVLESFELYAAKSSDEIVSEQAFVFEDRGGERITVRPELTPTLARMVAAKQNELTLPLRWWSFGRFWRYERPQKGRLREFYQWNCDWLGDDSINAEIGIIELAINSLVSLGITSADVVVELSDRALINAILTENNITGDKTRAAFRLLDKADKLSAEEQLKFGSELGLSTEDANTILSLISADEKTWQRSNKLKQVVEILTAKGYGDWLKVNLGLVRGFSYYTGLVFEATDRTGEFRALLGGGRFANLVSAVGGKPMSGIGFGMGCTVVLTYLEAKGLLPEYGSPTQACVICLDERAVSYAEEIVNNLRENNISAIDFRLASSPSDGLKFANRKNIKYAIIIGENELNSQTVTLKNMVTGDQEVVGRADVVTKF